MVASGRGVLSLFPTFSLTTHRLLEMHSLCMFGRAHLPPRPAPLAALTHLSPCIRARTGLRAPAHPATPSYTHQLNQVPPPPCGVLPPAPEHPWSPSCSLARTHAHARTPHAPAPGGGTGLRGRGAKSRVVGPSRSWLPRGSPGLALVCRSRQLALETILLLFLHLETLILPRAPSPAPKNRPEE